MKTPAATPFEEAEAARRHRTLARDPRYAHYARIPGRVCRCLEHFGCAFDRAPVAERLGAYYLFVGVADDAIDAGSVRAGAAILRRLTAPAPENDEDARPPAPIEIATAELRRHVGLEAHPLLRETLEGLYGAVVCEREALTMGDYVAARGAVGRLTAEVSYLLIRPLLSGGGREDVRRFLREVGAVGCLLDSVIDLRADERLGLLGFAPTLRDRATLAARTLLEGSKILLAHPRLCGLFLEAAADILRDRLAARAAPPAAPDPTHEVKAVHACERAA